MNTLGPRTVLLAAALIALLSPTARAAGFWPFKDNANKARHAGTTLHGSVQRTVRPLGNHVHVVKPVGGTRAPPKTILTKRPP
jgi:hypothetical protein